MAPVAESVDAPDSKSGSRKRVGVRVSLGALNEIKDLERYSGTLEVN